MLLVLSPFILKAQGKPKFQLKLRQSFQSEDSKPEPASFTYTKPKDSKASYLVDAALGVNLINKPNLGLNLFGEYHRNTLIDKEQNSIQSGLAIEWYTNNTFNTNSSLINSKTAILNFTAKYSKNIIDTTHSLQITAEITPLFLRGSFKKVLLPNDYHNHIGTVFDFLYFPAAGFENQYTFQAANDSAKGNVFRGVAKIYLGIKPLPKLFKSKIELFGDFAERYDFLNTTKFNERNHPLMQTGINFILLETASKYAKIGASFNKGSNPAQGLKDQEYYLISLKVKI
jgi:hypothetical protein